MACKSNFTHQMANFIENFKNESFIINFFKHFFEKFIITKCSNLRSQTTIKIKMTLQVTLTLIGKFWKIHPEIFPDMSWTDFLSCVMPSHDTGLDVSSGNWCSSYPESEQNCLGTNKFWPNEFSINRSRDFQLES